MRSTPRPVRIALLYALFGGLWILVTDTLVEGLFSGETSLVAAQMVKGLVYIGATTLLVYWLAKRDRNRTARDLARMREAQESLRQKESRWRALIDASPHAIFSLDLDGRVQTWNQAAERIFGWSAEEVEGRPLPIVPEAAEEESRRLRREVAAGRHISSLELARRRKDGTPIHVSLSAAPIPGGDHAPEAIMALVEDVTDRRAQAETLRRSQQMLARAEQVARLGSWEWQADRDVVRWSEELYRIFGMDPDQPVPSFADHDVLFPAPGFQRLREAVDAALSDGTPFELELQARRADGELFWAVSRGVPEFDEAGEVTGLFGSFQDVTRTKAREMERERLLHAIESAQEAVIITDVDGTIEYVNPAFERVSGYSRAEAEGQNPRFQKSGEQDDEFYRSMWQTLTAGRTWTGRIVNRRKNGELYTEEMSVSPVRDDSGAIVNYVAVKRDVTREVELEEQLRQAQRLESVGLLAGGLAHDFNNMLTVVQGHTELALDGVDPADPLHEDLLEIQRAAERSAGLIGQLLSFARQQPASPQTLDLNETVGSRLSLLRRLIGEDVTLRWQPDDERWPVRVDPGQVDQILTNLLVNARDAMDGAGVVEVETGRAEFDEEYCAENHGFLPGEYTMLAVSDTGAGMDRETAARIFEPFFTTKRQGEGTGLGLATVYGIVKQNEGFINVYSEPGEGTTFRIYLPRSSDDRALAPDESRPPSRPQGGKEVILLVEDEDAIRKITQRFLEKLGYQVLSAAGPGEAVELVRRRDGPIDLLLTDVVMPSQNGSDLYSHLVELRPGLRCVFMSGYTANVIARRGVLETDVHFLQKPFSLQQLARALREAMEG